MARSRRIEPFLLYVIDWDKREFTVEGPMTDDTPWIDRVVAAQKVGRHVTCCTAGTGPTREIAAEAWRAAYGHKLVERGSIPGAVNSN